MSSNIPRPGAVSRGDRGVSSLSRGKSDGTEEEDANNVAMQYDDVSEDSFHAAPHHVSTFRMVMEHTEEEAKQRLCPEGINQHMIPLCLSLAALIFTGYGSWGCDYFQGANIKFTGNEFGLWTLEDSTGKCQLWDKLFFSYDLGAPLIAARIFSMSAMLLGLGLTATMAQASQFHLASWGIGVGLFIIFIVSLSTTSIYNVWCVFWLWTYCIMVLIVRHQFIHPVARHISKRGARIIAGFFIVCFVCCLLTLVVLKSDWCTCNNITTEYLNGREAGDPCGGGQRCDLGPAGYCMITAAFLYLLSAVACLKFGIQAEELKQNARRPKEWYAHYPQQSIMTRARNIIRPKGSTNSSGSQYRDEYSGSNGSAAAAAAAAQVAAEDPERPSSPSENGKLASIGEDKPHEDSDLPMTTEATTEEQAPDGAAAVGDSVSGEANGDNDELDWDEDKRTRCQKCCCDYRVEPRTRKEKIMFWTFRVGLGLGLVIYGLFIYMLIGSRAENTSAAKAEETTKYFTLDAVCAFNPEDPNQPFETFENRAAAKSRNWTVAHCGDCGQCSNPHDIITYVETRKTIAKSSKKCGPNVYLGTYSDVADCLEERIGFTRPCTYCWADNMLNTGEKCLSTCLRTLFSGFMTDNNVEGAGDEGWLNQCLFCDEKRSGPKFVTCSGVARRRLGIVSEIERNPEEQCTRMDIHWDGVNFTSIGFYKNGENPS